MPTSQTQTSSRSAFTLIEILLVLTIIGVLASVLLPRMSFWFEPPSTILQRAIEEASDMALSGIPVRFSVKTSGSSRRGTILAEAFMKKEEPENSLSSFLGTNSNRPIVLEWQNIDMRNLPEDSGWRFEPAVIYFYTDGSCSPAKISKAGRDVPDRLADEYVLTVTGYCAKIEK
ncbi:MAG: type II secretion system protein [Synergistaceae bacterium]|nr:type II secretion system protein [Synergistaceae bacterium]